ncbi:MAG: MarR family transcriptional regulator [Luteolibacter sp.]
MNADAAGNPELERAAAAATDLRVVLGKLLRRLREETRPKNLSPSQIAVILHLEKKGPATVAALARAEGVRPQSMGATVASLTEAGLLNGSPDPADGRQTILSLTTACHKVIKDVRDAREDWLFRAIRSNLSPREQEKLAVAVDLLKRVADF